MKSFTLERSRAGLLIWALCAWLAVVPARVLAEDIDIFTTNNNAASTFDNPNVLIILDDTSNWSQQAQHWPGGGAQGQSELLAIQTVVGTLDASINVGLMEFVQNASGRPGGFIRYPVLQMTATNKTALQNLLQAIYNNFLHEKTASNADYSSVMFDAFKYFGGYTSPANVASNTPGTPADATHFGPMVFNQNTDPTIADVRGYTDATFSTYSGPISSANSCAKNFIIFIGNGFPNGDIGSPNPMDTYLAGIGGTTTQIAEPGFTTTTGNVTDNLGNTSACYSSLSACQTTDFAFECGTGLAYTTCSCVNTTSTTLGACPSGQSRYSVMATMPATSTTTGTTPSCYTSPPSTTGLTGNQFGMTCPSGTVCTYSAGGTAASGAACGTTSGTTPGLSQTANTTACYNNSNAAQTANDHGGLAPPGSAVVTINLTTGAMTSTTYTAAYAWGNTGTSTGCGSGKKFPVTMTLTPTSVVTSHYTVTQTATGSASTTAIGNTFACAATAPTSLTSSDPACPSGATCSIGSALSASATASCPSGSALYLVQGTYTTAQITPTNTYAVPASNVQRMTDEWARYMYQTDANAAAGQQNITTYTVDVFNAKQDANQTGLLMSMAHVGGGKYFAAKNQNDIVVALKNIMSEIQAVNTVFASASLPVNATNRAQNENQVFIGMFRPDPSALPRWYGNLKQYQLANFSGVIDLADVNGIQAINLQTGFITDCATSFWTGDSGTYWQNIVSNPPAEGKCTTTSFNKWSDSPDGPLVEKGAAAEVVRKGNSPPSTDSTPTYTFNRNVLTQSGSSLTPVAFTTSSSGLSQNVVDFILGKDVNNELGSTTFSLPTTTTRPSLHGDVVHSRPLPVNYGTVADPTAGVTVFYGANDGTLRAVNATNGQERWAFIAPEFFPRLSRLMTDSPIVQFPNQTAGISPTPTPKDYFWDGSAGVYQTLNNSSIWIFPTMRRGGRMIYAFDVKPVDSPTLLWKLGCPDLTDDTGCSAPGGTDVSGIGQTWSTPAVAFIKGYPTPGAEEPVLVVGGGYDGGGRSGCEDDDSSTINCTSSPPKGAHIYVIKASDGTILQTFDTLHSVASDVAMVDVNNDGFVDYAYVADLGGNFYRVDFVDGANSYASLSAANWKIYRVAYTDGTGSPNTPAPRKFFFPPALLFTGGSVYVAAGSGDREHPLWTDYATTEVLNRFYVYVDKLATKPTNAQSVNLDDTTLLNDNTSSTSCTSPQVLTTSAKKGWFMDLNQNGTQDANGLTGEQTVTSALILGGMVTFSTNRPLPPSSSSCSTTLGEARGYWVNLLNGSGGIGTAINNTCGGTRSSTFVGGGLPPSPVTGVVPVGGISRTVVIGAVQRDGSASAPIAGQKVVPSIKAIRKRLYWFKNVDN